MAIGFRWRHHFWLRPSTTFDAAIYERKRVEADDTSTLDDASSWDREFDAGTYYTVFTVTSQPFTSGRCLYVESNGNFDLEITHYDSVAAATSLEEFTFRNQISTRQYKFFIEGLDIRLVRVRAVTATRRISGAVGAL